MEYYVGDIIYYEYDGEENYGVIYEIIKTAFEVQLWASWGNSEKGAIENSKAGENCGWMNQKDVIIFKRANRVLAEFLA